MVWELIGYGTDSRYDDVRHREYTTSRKKAEMFERIPRIQFSDSGHGVVFHAVEHHGKRKPVRSMDYVRKQLDLLRAERSPNAERTEVGS